MTHQVTINEGLSTAILPVLKVLRAMGLFPVTYQNNTISWSLRRYLISFLMFTIIASWGIWGFVNDMTAASFLTLGFRGTIDFFITSTEVTEIIGSGFYFVVSTKFKTKSMIRSLENFDKIDNVVTPIFVRQIRRKSVFVTACALSFMMVLYVFDLFMWGNNSWEGLNNYMGYYIMFTVGICNEIMYWHWVNLIYYRILAMNTYIKDLPRHGTTCKNVSNLIIVYDCICDSIETFNTCFGNSTTMIILSCYISLVIGPYVVLVMTSSNEMSLLNYVYFVWVSVHICRLFVVLNVCHRCEYLRGKTSGLLFRLLTNPLEKDVRQKVFSSISAYWMILVQFSARLES